MRGYLPARTEGCPRAIAAAVFVADSGLLHEVHACLHDLSIRLALEEPAVGDWSGLRPRLQRANPDLVIFEIGETAPEAAEAAIRDLKGCVPEASVIAVARVAETNHLLAALRAGCSDYVSPPLATSLPAAITRIAQDAASASPQEPVRPGGATIGFLAAKGGVGATTIACHVARELRSFVKGRPLLLDLDLVGGEVAYQMQTTDSRRSVLDAAANLHRMDASYFGALVTERQGVDVLGAPGPAALKSPVSPEQVASVLGFIRSQYEFTVVDLGRGMNAIIDRALDEIDRVLVVTTPEVPAVEQARALVTYLTETRMPRVRASVIVNRVPRKRKWEGFERLVSDLPVCGGICSDYQTLYDASIDAQLVSPRSDLGRDFTGLARMIAGVEGDGQNQASAVRFAWSRATSYFF